MTMIYGLSVFMYIRDSYAMQFLGFVACGVLCVPFTAGVHLLEHDCKANCCHFKDTFALSASPLN